MLLTTEMARLARQAVRAATPALQNAKLRKRERSAFHSIVCETPMKSADSLANASEFGRGLLALSQVNAWERDNIPYIDTASGRDLYFLLAGNALLSEEPNKPPVKSHTLNLNARTMRNRIKDFHAAGFIIIATSPDDGRARTIEPSEKLLRLFKEHNQAAKDIFSKHFAFFSK